MDHVVHTVVAEAAKANSTSDEEVLLIFGLLTPVNTILVTVILFMISGWLYAPDFPSPRAPPPARLFRTFTPRTLWPNQGANGSPIFVAIRGKVFDVSSRPQFYGPGASYANFAGRDAGRGLAKGSFAEEFTQVDFEGELDGLEDLNEQEREALEGWEESFRSKYTIIGELISEKESERRAAAEKK